MSFDLRGQALNVLLITADQWRGDCLSSAGHPLVKTPHLDALASEGVRFARHYACATPCSPARACLYTGLYQMNNRVCINGTPLDSRHDNIALAARRAGYNPTLFGYTDTAIDPRTIARKDPRRSTYESSLPGFATQVSLTESETAWRLWLADKGISDALQAQLHQPANGVDDPPRSAAPQYPASLSPSKFLVDEFIHWLGNSTQRATGNAWFAHLSLLRPHPPFTAPEPYNSSVNPSTISGFADNASWHNAANTHPFVKHVTQTLTCDRFIAGASGLVRDWSIQDLQHIAATYYGMIAEVDAQLGRVFAELHSLSLWQNTLIIFTSDHGEMMGDHGLLGKTGFYDAAYHTPLIIRDPRQADTGGRVVTRFTESVDIMPTILDCIGEAIPIQLDGRSLMPMLAGADPQHWRIAACSEYDFRNISSDSSRQLFDLPAQRCNLSIIRDQQYKYIHFAGLPAVLFDLQSDPEERFNVANNPEYRDQRLHYAEALLGWRAEHLDQTLAMSALTDSGWLQKN